MKKIIQKTLIIFLAIIGVSIWLFLLKQGGLQRFREIDTGYAVTKGGRAQKGIEEIKQHGCGACHNIPGVPCAFGKIGPSLDEFKDRNMIAGRLSNSEENLVKWIQNPRHVDPKTAMPDLKVTEEEAKNIAAYLYTLKH